jgi:hypothetical protein
MAIGFPVKDDYVTGDVLTAANMNDLSGSVNLLESAQYAAGKNKIINGNMGVWQRGTSTTLTNNTHGFGPDRFRAYVTFSAGTSTFAQQTFTPGTAPVAGYEGTFFSRVTCGSTTTYAEISQKIEDVRILAGQTATLSFYAKSSVAIVFKPYLIQQFGSGGSGDVATAGSDVTLTTSWARYTATISVPSISGKTIGTNSCLLAAIAYVSGTLNSATIDTWGWQVEASSTASDFATATGTVQGELAACQRYYFRKNTSGVNNARMALGFATSTTRAQMQVVMPVQMRVTPTSVDYSTIALADGATADKAVTAVVLDSPTSDVPNVYMDVASGLTQFRPYQLNTNSTSGYIAFSAEL